MSIDLNRAREIFVAAVGKAPAEQAGLIAISCGDDAALRNHVENLLRADASAGSFLDQPAAAGLASTIDQAPAECPGTMIGPYKIVELIGEGGMGAVYLAQQTEPVKRLVALKVIKAGMDSRQVIARFEAERQALALMDHPNIAKVHEAGTTPNGRPYFVMELVKGMPLTKFCDERKLPPRERLELFLPVCHAIQHAHQKGIIHRDLKPTNVLVALYDGKPVPKVIDFGVAKAAGQPLTEKTLVTGLGAVVGTPEYMSPEQAELNQLDVDTRSDIYSLGVLLYELLTGSPPFTKKDLEKAGMLEMLRVIREQEPSRPSTKLSTAEGLATLAANRGMEPAKLTRLVRGELDWIVMKALEKDRIRRYETANGFAMDIQRYLADEPVEACPPSIRYRLGKSLRRNRGAVVVGSIVSLALLGGLIGAVYGSIEARNKREVADLYQQAVEARKEAEAARDSEKDSKRLVEVARETLAAVEYGRTMQLALQAWRDGDIPSALALLDGTRADLRGWEWHYVSRLCHTELLTLKGHTNSVLSAAFSPDGTRVVTASTDKTVSIWDARTGAELLILKGHVQGVGTAAFSPDGMRVVSGSSDGTARVWDVRTGAEILTLSGHHPDVRAAAFSPDGTRVVTAGTNDTLRIWDAKTGSAVLTFKGPALKNPMDIRVAAFSPDGSLLLTGGSDMLARVWDAKTGDELRTLKGHHREIRAANFSPDGARVVTSGGDSRARIWDATTGAEVLTLKGHFGVVWSAAFSPDGTRVVTACEDGTSRVWDARTGAELLVFRGPLREILSASFSPDGTRVVTGGSGGTARVWNTRARTEPVVLNGHTWEVTAVSFSPDGARVVTGSWDKSVRVWDTRTGAESLALKGHTHVVWSVSFSPDGTRVLTASGDNTARIWHAGTGTEVLTLKGHTQWVTGAAFSPDGTRVVTACGDGMVRLWDAKSGADVLTLKGRSMGWSVTFSPDGTRVLGSLGGSAHVWDAKTGDDVLTFKGHLAEIRAAAFSPDGTRVVTGSWDNTARIWDAKTGAELFALKGHTSPIWSASFSPDGTRVVTGSWDNTARIWDAKTGAELLTLKGHTGRVYSASFSPDGSRVLTGSGDNTSRIWDATPLSKPGGAATGPGPRGARSD